NVSQVVYRIAHTISTFGGEHGYFRAKEDADTFEDELTFMLLTQRGAFNSPFRPFILASTSVGQEGLDFHLYCRALYHWNLPSNPVDLEQREGRIHRYKGHVIRKNLAEAFGLAGTEGAVDPWEALFARAAATRDPAATDLVPYW
ncbi:MAG: helicase-related protein, partial [Myxococcota bacterium]|nr:helicase-related protein [Myxococcota bacterium]